MSHKDFNRKKILLQHFFERVAGKASKDTKFVQRTSKMNGKIFAMTLILGWTENPQATLNELVQCSAELGVDISESGLHQRMNETAVEYLKELLAYSLIIFRENARLPEGILEHFSSIDILDSSIITLPESLQGLFAGFGMKGGQAAAKLQLSFDYLTGDLNAVELVGSREPDQKCTLHTDYAQPDSLHLFDLGYFKQGVLADLDGAGAYFISRLQTQTGLYVSANDEEPIDLLSFLQAQTETQGEKKLHCGSKVRQLVRFIFQRLPDDVVEERRRKAHAKARKKGKTCTKRHLALLAWSLFITNVPEEWLTADQVMMVYRVRWQVELIFKLWKSQAKLDKIGKWRPTRVLCQLYGRLLAVVLFQWSVAPWRISCQGELSLPKAFHIMRRHALRLLDAIANNWNGVATILEKLAGDFLRFAQKDSRKKSPSTLQLLQISGA